MPRVCLLLQKLDLRVLLIGLEEVILPKAKRRSQRAIELYEERPIKKARDMLDFIKALDEDEGIRVVGDAKNHENGGFVFVGYYRGSYCVNICDRVWNPKLRKYVAGEKDEWYYFETARETFNFVQKEAKKPLQAWLY